MKVSVIIRTKNEERMLSQCLTMIQNQTHKDCEIIIVDSGSTDDTIEIAKRFHCLIIEIPPEKFTFGYALNKGIRETSGDIAVAISAHCLPYNNEWLSLLTQKFREVPNLAGVYGRQVPFSDASPIEKRGLKEAFPKGDQFILKNDSRFSNANSAIAKKVWEQHPFNEKLTGAEDIDWCKNVLEEKYLIGYEPRSTVYHSHHETYKQIHHRFKRETMALAAIRSNFFHKKGGVGYIARWMRSILLDYCFLIQNPVSVFYFIRWTILVPFYRIGVYYGQYSGGKEAR